MDPQRRGIRAPGRFHAGLRRGGRPLNPISEAELRGYLAQIGWEIHDSPNWAREMMNLVPIAIGLRSAELKEAAIATATAYGTVDVFHGDKTNCKVQDAVQALNDPRTKVKAP